MNICMLSELFYPFMLGGAERRYYEIAKRLAKRHDVTVYSLRFHGFKESEIIDNIRIIRTGAKHPLDRRSLPHLSTYWPAFVKAFGNDHDVMDANWGVSSFSGFFKIFTKKPVVATFHDVYWDQWKKYFGFPVSLAGRASELLFSKLPFNKIIANSPETARKLKRLGFSSNVTTIASGVDTKLIDSVKTEKENGSIVFVGRLAKYKNVDKLITSFKKIQEVNPNASLKIVGNGPEENNLKKLAKDLGINARFYGFVSEKEKIRLIKSSSVLVNPSSVEGLGLILLEAMACGTPVTAKDIPAYFFCNKNNSLLYNDDKQLAPALMKLMESKNLAKKLARNGLKTAEKFSWDGVALQIENVYEGLI